MKRTLLLLLCLSLVLSLTACIEKTDQPSTPADTTALDASDSGQGGYQEKIIFAVNGQPTTNDTQSLTNVIHNRIFLMTHDTLAYFDDLTASVQPNLAETWEWEDETTIVFYLRNDVIFHDGSPFTADDCIFTFERGMESPACGAIYSSFESYEAVDDYTLKIKLASANADLVQTMTKPCYAILSREACEADAENGCAIGTGPWMWDQWEVNNYVQLKSFDKCWSGVNPTQTFVYQYISEDSSRLIALRTGEVDLCYSPSMLELSHVEKDQQLKLLSYESYTTAYFAFNMEREPFASNEKLRQAVASVINREDIIAVSLSGYGTPATTFWGPRMYGYYDGFDLVSSDVETAKQLLAEAGYPNGTSFEVMAYGSEYLGACQVIQAELNQIGINLVINEVDSAGLVSRNNESDFDTMVYGRAFGTCAEDIRPQYVKGFIGNRAKYENPEIRQLLDKGIQVFTDEERLPIYKEIQTIAANDCAYIPLYYPVEYVACVNGVSGVDFCSSNFDMSYIVIQK